MLKTHHLEMLIAHHDEPIPIDFLNTQMPAQFLIAPSLSERQLKKWKSRRMAFFLLYQLFKKLSLNPTLLTKIKRTQSGRPFIADKRIDFNISHSGDWVAVVLSYHPQQPSVVGIDIEHPQKRRRYHDLLNYYGSAEEKQFLTTTNPLPSLSTVADRFYLTWCLREAVLKSQGIGIIKLSEVQHSPNNQTIHSAYCPNGTFLFYNQLPCYLGVFFEHIPHLPQIPLQFFEWKANHFYPLDTLSPIIYTVN